jgi:hypothetical protein
MRILVAGHFKYAMHYGIMQKLYHAMIRLGHAVMLFDDRTVARRATWFGGRQVGIAPMNLRFLRAAKEFQPDIIVLGHCEMIWNVTLNQIRRSLPHTKIIYRNVDPLMHVQNVKDIHNRTDSVDWIFLTTAGDALSQFSGKRAKIAHIPNPVDAAMETQQAFACPAYTHDLFYAIGGVYANDPRPAVAQGILDACPGVSCYFGGMFGNPHIFGPAYYAKLATVKMGLNYSRENDVYLYSSDRMAQYMGNGLLTFVHRDTGFGELFSDEDIAFFSNTNELHEKIRFYAHNDDERVRVARQGWQKIHTVFSSDQVARFMIQCAVGDPIAAGQFHWPTQAF